MARGLLDRATFDSIPGIEVQDRRVDAVIFIGASQIWGPPVEDAQPLDYGAALRALRGLVLPGGRLVNMRNSALHMKRATEAYSG